MTSARPGHILSSAPIEERYASDHAPHAQKGIAEMSQTPTVPPLVTQSMKFVLRSPLHGMVSNTILLISFRGRKTGKAYTTPVCYSQYGNELHIFTHAGWWKNLRGGAPVSLRLRGQDVQGTADAIAEDKRVVAAGLAAHLQKVPSDRRYYSVSLDDQGNPKPEDVDKAVQTVVMIRVRLC